MINDKMVMMKNLSTDIKSVSPRIDESNAKAQKGSGDRRETEEKSQRDVRARDHERSGTEHDRPIDLGRDRQQIAGN